MISRVIVFDLCDNPVRGLLTATVLKGRNRLRELRWHDELSQWLIQARFCFLGLKSLALTTC